MSCSGCGFQLAVDDSFCSCCGADVHVHSRVPDPRHQAPAPGQPGRHAKSGLKSRPSCPCGATQIGADGVCTQCGAMPAARDDMSVSLKEGLALRTHVGRKHWPNEDFGMVDHEAAGELCYRWIVVSDGVSSAQSAEIASECACNAVSDSLRQSVRSGITPLEAIQLSIAAAQEKVLEIPFNGPNGKKKEPPEATLAVAIFDKETAWLGWLGDTRIYSVVKGPRGLFANLLTRDHSYANAMIDLGRMNLQEALQSPDCNAITQSLGMLPEGESLEPSFRQVSLQGAIYLIACSDGLWNYIHPVQDQPAELLATLAAQTPDDPELLAFKLVDHANECGGRDNITVAIAKL